MTSPRPCPSKMRISTVQLSECRQTKIRSPRRKTLYRWRRNFQKRDRMMSLRHQSSIRYLLSARRRRSILKVSSYKSIRHNCLRATSSLLSIRPIKRSKRSNRGSLSQPISVDLTTTTTVRKLEVHGSLCLRKKTT